MALACLVLGTHNLKKRLELEGLLQLPQLPLLTLADYKTDQTAAETGSTFAENAAQKAQTYARLLGEWVLGEDSGIEVFALDGRPGIYSARYAAETVGDAGEAAAVENAAAKNAAAIDAANNARLLQELASVRPDQRQAQYVCHMAVADPQGQIRAAVEATCQGRIRAAPSGTGGFGYDPLFEIPEYHKTFGELGTAVKSTISHRARAARLLRPLLVALM